MVPLHVAEPDRCQLAHQALQQWLGAQFLVSKPPRHHAADTGSTLSHRAPITAFQMGDKATVTTTILISHSMDFKYSYPATEESRKYVPFHVDTKLPPSPSVGADTTHNKHKLFDAASSGKHSLGDYITDPKPSPPPLPVGLDTGCYNHTWLDGASGSNHCLGGNGRAAFKQWPSCDKKRQYQQFSPSQVAVMMQPRTARNMPITC